MTKKLFVVGALLLNCGIFTDRLNACGDKNSNSARGIWRGLQRIGKHEAILIVLSPDVQKALPRFSQAEMDLRDAGYDPTTIVGTEYIAAKLRERKWALIVAGPADAAIVEAAQGPARILLIAMGASKQDEKAAKKRYSGVITKTASSSIVDDLADALEVSMRAANKAKPNKHA